MKGDVNPYQNKWENLPIQALHPYPKNYADLPI